MKADDPYPNPPIIRADIEHMRQDDPEGDDQEGSAILWLCMVLFTAAAVVVLCSAAFCALQVFK